MAGCAGSCCRTCSAASSLGFSGALTQGCSLMPCMTHIHTYVAESSLVVMQCRCRCRSCCTILLRATQLLSTLTMLVCCLQCCCCCCCSKPALRPVLATHALAACWCCCTEAHLYRDALRLICHKDATQQVLEFIAELVGMLLCSRTRGVSERVRQF